MANWKCRILGHKLRDISDGEGLVNVGICEREGTIHAINSEKSARYEDRYIAGPFAGLGEFKVNVGFTHWARSEDEAYEQVAAALRRAGFEVRL